jgi:hypothetical protein
MECEPKVCRQITRPPREWKNFCIEERERKRPMGLSLVFDDDDDKLLK